MTIANTVEERILALQDKKRALAEAAIEGKAVGKLSMKDILNLFRRDAEADDHGDLDLDKPRILGDVIADMDERGKGVGRMGMRANPPAMEKERGGGRDEGIWGRRW